MGSVGKSTAPATAPTQQQDERRSQVDNVNGWEYLGVVENVDELESALQRARSSTRVLAVYRALRAQDEWITAELDRLSNGTADVNGNSNVLLTQRRRVRQLLRRIRES